jgi:hypothetical protein
MLEIKPLGSPKGEPMKKRWVIPNAVLLMLFLGVLTSQNAQDVSTGAEKTDPLRHQLAIALLRTINTAEVVDQSTYGFYSSWQTLLSHNPKYFDEFIATHRRELPNTQQFADPPEILPGWDLRMNMHADGQGYDLLLRDMTDKKCGYAAVTNENVIIWQAKAIDCEI